VAGTKEGETVQESSRAYIPAAGSHAALPLYDPIVKLLGVDAARRELLDRASIQPGHRVLDIGCGTGTMAVLIKRLHPEVEVVGIDPDPKALARGRRKAERAATSIQFDQGFADDMPYPDASIDRVFSSLMFHHLPREVKEGTLREVRRVLKPGGLFGLLDFAGPDAGTKGLMMRLFHSNGLLADNAERVVLELMREAGLERPAKVGQGTVFLGLARVNYFQATKSAKA
jgi:ubiquinone/menaquinone biosynthesis C-methylase UbiE